MTEKRFTIVNMGLDGQFIKENGKIMTIERVVNLLNENEQLKQSNQKLNDELQETMGYLALKSGVEKENEQLKKEIEELEFKLRTIEAYDRTVKEEHSDTVYDFKKKLETW